MKKSLVSVAALLSAVTLLFTGCAGNKPNGGEPETTTSFKELASYYDELAKGDIAVEIETTENKNKYYEFSGDPNLLPEGVFDKLENIVRSRYTTMYNRYGKGFTCPKITLVIDVNYTAESACHASDKTIYINPNWFVDHPDDCDALLSAIAKTMQEYSGTYPDWIKSSIQAYLRSEYKTQYADKNWELPGSYTGKSYEEGGIYGAAFLKWIDAKNEQDIIYRLNKVLLDGSYKESFWTDETGLTFGQLWSLYTEK